MKYLIFLLHAFLFVLGKAQTIEATVIVGDSSNKYAIDSKLWNQKQQLLFLDENIPQISAIDYFEIYGNQYVPLYIPEIMNHQGDSLDGYIYPELIVRGTMDLYFLAKENRMFIIKGIQKEEIYQVTNSQGKKQDLHKSVLQRLMIDCPVMNVFKINKLKFSLPHIKHAIIQYNQQCGELIYRSKVGFGLEAGPLVGYNSLRYSIDEISQRSNEFLSFHWQAGAQSFDNPTVGAYANFSVKKPILRPEIIASLIYVKFDSEHYREEALGIGVIGFRSFTHHFSFDALAFSTTGRVIIPIRRFEAFVGLGLQTNLRIQTSGTVLLHEEAKYTPPREKLFVFDDSEYDAVTNSYVVEAGLRYQRFQLSANSAGEFSAYFNIPSEDIRLYTISIGYTLL